MSRLQALDLRPAVLYVLLTKFWQLAAGAVTLTLIARYFQPELQGFYYTFGGLLALQTFLELGFSVVITNVASHEWADLRLTEDRAIAGEEHALGRLASLARLVFQWFGAGTILYVLLIGASGTFFLGMSPDHGIAWREPWWALVIVSSLQFWALPFSSLLEGCNQVANVHRFRMHHALWGNAVLWIAIVMGAGLWAAVIWSATNVIRELVILGYYGRFFGTLRRAHGAAMEWQSEIWPMQWRLALMGAVNYFMVALFTPVMFHYHGAVLAGRMGMTLQLVHTLQAATLAWVSTRVPEFGALAAKRNYDLLDRVWLRAAFLSAGMFLVGGAVLLLVLALLPAMLPAFAERLLTPGTTAVLLAAAAFGQIIGSFATYLRAYKKEALLLPGVAGGLVTGALVWMLGRQYGAMGAAAGYVIGVGGVVFPWVLWKWSSLRRAWQTSIA